MSNDFTFAFSSDEVLLQYRRALRQLLYEHGIPSNPAVTDDWILDQVRQLLAKHRTLQARVEQLDTMLEDLANG